jgi:hypothetical protein
MSCCPLALAPVPAADSNPVVIYTRGRSIVFFCSLFLSLLFLANTHKSYAYIINTHVMYKAAGPGCLHSLAYVSTCGW